jgi:hypothetical protein
MWNAAKRVRPIVAEMEAQGGAMEAWRGHALS